MTRLGLRRRNNGRCYGGQRRGVAGTVSNQPMGEMGKYKLDMSLNLESLHHLQEPGQKMPDADTSRQHDRYGRWGPWGLLDHVW
jgi:hypothetical protein